VLITNITYNDSDDVRSFRQEAHLIHLIQSHIVDNLQAVKLPLVTNIPVETYDPRFLHLLMRVLVKVDIGWISKVFQFQDPRQMGRKLVDGDGRKVYHNSSRVCTAGSPGECCTLIAEHGHFCDWC